ncbi:hypothetical protein MKX03_008930 [Papaver bracteatum]|nr:hypothetical protein MKX03_008930 [Papaver bracteatum]
MGGAAAGEETDYDRDPEFAAILGNLLDNPDNGQSRERLRKKRNKVSQAKTGSAVPVKVMFNGFDFSSSYIWFEFYNAPLPSNVSLICTIRSWHIIGRLGRFNSMNMLVAFASDAQLTISFWLLSPSLIYVLVLSYRANVSPTKFYNIGDFEIQDNVACIWMDIGISEPLLLNVLINALSQMTSDGSEFERWKESLTSEAAGCSVHKI